MRKEEKFLNWLVELRNPDNSELLESVVKAFGELLEYNDSGSAGTNNSNNATYMDNQLNTKPGSAGFQDNLVEEVDDDSLLEFAAPAIVTAASGAAISANPDENMTSPMISDMQPTASNQMAVTDSATDDKESDNDNVKELKELSNDVGSIMEKLKKIMARSANGREVIMEDTIPKY